MFILLDVGGLRVSELLGIELERDVDFKMYSIHIIGKGNKIRSIFMEKIIYEAIITYFLCIFPLLDECKYQLH